MSLFFCFLWIIKIRMFCQSQSDVLKEMTVSDSKKIKKCHTRAATLPKRHNDIPHICMLLCTVCSACLVEIFDHTITHFLCKNWSSASLDQLK